MKDVNFEKYPHSEEVCSLNGENNTIGNVRLSWPEIDVSTSAATNAKRRNTTVSDPGAYTRQTSTISRAWNTWSIREVLQSREESSPSDQDKSNENGENHCDISERTMNQIGISREMERNRYFSRKPENETCNTENTEQTYKKKFCASVRTFVVYLSLLQLVQVMGSGYSKSALTSIQRRYRLSTFSIGILQSCFHVGNISVILFVSYFGSRWNRPRAIAIGSLMMAVSSLMSAMPQFVGSRYRVIETDAARQSLLNSKIPVQMLLNDILNDTQRPSPLSFDRRSFEKTDSTNYPDDETNADSGISSILSFTKSKRKARLCKSKSLNVANGERAHLISPVLDINRIRTGVSQPFAKRRPDFVQGETKVPALGRERNGTVENGGLSEEEYWDDSSLYIFIAIGSVLKGMGHSPLHPLGMSFVDDFATQRNSAVYIGIVSALSLLGPAFGFILGSLTAGLWVDLGWVDNSGNDIGPEHPLWVGAWWLGYLVTGTLLLVATIPFCLFPRQIEEEKDEEEELQGACLMCFKKCYTYRSNEESENEDRNYTELTHRARNSIVSHDNPVAKAEIPDSEVAANDKGEPDPGATALKYADGRLGERLHAYEKMLLIGPNVRTDANMPNEMVQMLETPEVVYDHGIDKAAELIGYFRLPLPKQCEEDCHNLSANCEKCIPSSTSELQIKTSCFHSLTPRIPKSASVPAVNYNQFRTKFRKLQEDKLNTSTTHNKHSIRSLPSFVKHSRNRLGSRSTRRGSRLEKLVLTDFTASLKSLLSDIVFLSITLAFVCLTSFLAASVTYVSKYMETQFSVTASFANLLNGSVNLPMAVVGNLLGGWVIRRLNLNVKRTMGVAVTGLALTLICVATLFFFRCSQGQQFDSAVVSESYTCSDACQCGEEYSPVCDLSTNITYRSACHAGCTKMNIWRGMQVFHKCMCLAPSHHTERTREKTSAVSIEPINARKILFRGPCEKFDCSRSHLPIFVGIMGAASLTAGLASTPSTLVILRIVPPKEKAFAIGIVFVFTRVLAWIPAPVYVGYVIDSACLRWSDVMSRSLRENVTDSRLPDERRHCEIYDKDGLRKSFFATAGALLVLSLIFYILAFFLQTRRQSKQAASSQNHSVRSLVPIHHGDAATSTSLYFPPNAYDLPQPSCLYENDTHGEDEDVTSNHSHRIIEIDESAVKPVDDQASPSGKPSEPKPIVVSISVSAPEYLTTQVGPRRVGNTESPKHLNKQRMIVRATAV